MRLIRTECATVTAKNYSEYLMTAIAQIGTELQCLVYSETEDYRSDAAVVYKVQIKSDDIHYEPICVISNTLDGRNFDIILHSLRLLEEPWDLVRYGTNFSTGILSMESRSWYEPINKCVVRNGEFDMALTESAYIHYTDIHEEYDGDAYAISTLAMASNTAHTIYTHQGQLQKALPSYIQPFSTDNAVITHDIYYINCNLGYATRFVYQKLLSISLAAEVTVDDLYAALVKFDARLDVVTHGASFDNGKLLLHKRDVATVLELNVVCGNVDFPGAVSGSIHFVPEEY